MKQCSKCKEWKSESEFKGRKDTKDRLQYYCRICDTRASKIPVKKWKETLAGKESAKRTLQKYREKGKHVPIERAYRKNNPDKIKARNAINGKIRRGKFPHISTQRCNKCNDPAYEYHHYLGYAPEHRLDVIPLCHNCHTLAEKKLLNA